MLILGRIDRELHSNERLELKFGLSLEFLTKYLLESFLMYSFVCSGFLKRVFLCPSISIHDIFKLRRHLDSETYGRLPFDGNFLISHVKIKIIAEISR